jgi:O-antigen/teichoic acid export membrane protein
MKLNKKALKKSFFASFARSTGVVFGACAGTLLTRSLGHRLTDVYFALVLGTVAFFLIWFAEYEREANDE